MYKLLPYLKALSRNIGGVVVLTEAEYNALTTKDPNTIYFVKV